MYFRDVLHRIAPS